MTNELPSRAAARPSSPAWVAAIAILLLVAAACSPAPAPSGSPPGSAPPSVAPTPTATPEVVGVAHPTGPTDIVLRMEEGGGFMPLEANATYAPSFTLYGDGTVIFRDPYTLPPESNDGIRRSIPFQTIRLDEAGIQALLADALGPGGLAIAKGPYHGMGADIPTTTFTITAEGRTKQVSVTGLSPDIHPQNAAVVTVLSAYAERLRGFGDDVAGEQPYRPATYRGILIPVDQPFGPVHAWPWPDIQPQEFVGGINEFFLTRTMAAAEVATLGITSIEGGMEGVALQSGAKIYTFALRPHLPEEAGEGPELQ